MRLLFASLALSTLLATLGCSEPESGYGPEPPPPPSSFLERTSPENLLHNLRQAYSEMKIGEYAPLFSEDFSYFSWNAAGDSLPGVSWELEEELQIHRRLFGENEQILIDWRPEARAEPVQENTDARIHVRSTFLEVTQRLPTGEPLFLQVAGDQEFHFRLTDETTDEGDAIWAIVLWEDEGGGWGRLKSQYRD